MKSIVKGIVSKKVYYMTPKANLYRKFIAFSSDGSPKLGVTENSDHTGILGYEIIKNVDEITLIETYSLHKLLNVDEYINIGGQDYQIVKVVNGSDGTMYYYVNVEIDDEESKNKALQDIEQRDIFVKGWKAACGIKNPRIDEYSAEIDTLKKEIELITKAKNTVNRKWYERGTKNEE